MRKTERRKRRLGEKLTVVVHKVGHRDSKDRGIKAGEKTSDTLALDDLAHGIGNGGLGALGLDLRARGKRDQRIGEDHGEDTTAGAGNSVENLRSVVSISRESSCLLPAGVLARLQYPHA